MERSPPLLVKHLVHVSYGRKIPYFFRSFEKTTSHIVPILGAGTQDLGYITNETHKKIYHLFPDEETIIVSRIGTARIHYFEKLSCIAPTEDTFILQNSEPEQLHFKFMYYYLLSMKQELTNCMGGTAIKHLQIQTIQNIVVQCDL